jgi:3-deoxy-D-manno-octulosonic acid (KDO) 8-phosphate synthase
MRMMKAKPFKIGNVTVGGKNLLLILGPCVMESEKSARRDEDREFATDTEAVATLIEQGQFARFVPDLLSDLGCG